jgi:hypothetical protein
MHREWNCSLIHPPPPLPTLWVFVAWCIIKHRDNCKFTFYYSFLLGIFWSNFKSTCKFYVEYFVCPLQTSLASYIVYLHSAPFNDFEPTRRYRLPNYCHFEPTRRYRLPNYCHIEPTRRYRLPNHCHFEPTRRYRLPNHCHIWLLHYACIF